MNTNPSEHYDDMGMGYIRKSKQNLHNVYYNNPAIISLVGEVKGKEIFEVGCGGGSITEWLVKEGASVTACDISEQMVKYTKKKLGSKAKVLIADISKPLDFLETNSTDMIIASLVLHYISNWLSVFSEFDRVLKKDGSIVISVHHPHADWKWFDKTNYFKKDLYEDTWTIDGKPYPVSFYHRTLANMFAIFRKFGFFVDVLLEPFPIPEAKEVDAKNYEHLLKNPHFLFLRLKKEE
ncbi:MAG: class I SAM-dependent methyltransferase [Candidatus Heimdallarchaeota archaeon]|nr:class I SAM-dependent methyltransferase [Candidatus Heimdallarchaeota archaeon]